MEKSPSTAFTNLWMTDRDRQFREVFNDDRLHGLVLLAVSPDLSPLLRIHSGRIEQPLGKSPAHRLNALPHPAFFNDSGYRGMQLKYKIFREEPDREDISTQIYS